MSAFARRSQRGAGSNGANGAILYLTPSTGAFATGATVTVTIRENSGVTPVNAVQANLSYPAGVLQFESTSTATSPFTTTLQNEGGSGSVQLGVGVLGGSVTGDQVVGVVTFTALAAGAASIAFTAGSGVARESDSIDICNQQNGAAYTIT